MPRPLISIQTLLRVGWKASFQQLRGVDHFDIIENLTREDDVLTQVGLTPTTVFLNGQRGSHAHTWAWPGRQEQRERLAVPRWKSQSRLHRRACGECLLFIIVVVETMSHCITLAGLGLKI